LAAWAHAAPSAAPPAAPSAAPEKALPRLVDLGAGRCIPCKKMAPIIAELRKDYAGIVDVVFVEGLPGEARDHAGRQGPGGQSRERVLMS
jgi:thioredoxin 1